MKTLLPLGLLLAVPAQAQDAQVYHASATWPVHASGDACTLVQAAPAAGSVLSVSYDGAEVTLTSTAEVESELPRSGKLPLTSVFLENGDGDYDDGWGAREFSYDGNGRIYRFSARFSGERNVRQILSDLTESRKIGLLQNGQAIMAYELEGIDGSVAELRNCAARTVAAN